MQTKIYTLVIGLLSASLLINCGGNKEEEKKDDESVSALGAFGAMKEMAAQAEEIGRAHV